MAGVELGPLLTNEEVEPPKQLPIMTRQQVADVACTEKVLVILHNAVYDLTEFVELHPGGGSVLTAFVGRDATGAFDAIGHSEQAHTWREQYKVAVLPQEEHT